MIAFLLNLVLLELVIILHLQSPKIRLFRKCKLAKFRKLHASEKYQFYSIYNDALLISSLAMYLCSCDVGPIYYNCIFLAIKVIWICYKQILTNFLLLCLCANTAKIYFLNKINNQHQPCLPASCTLVQQSDNKDLAYTLEWADIKVKSKNWVIYSVAKRKGILVLESHSRAMFLCYYLLLNYSIYIYGFGYICVFLSKEDLETFTKKQIYLLMCSQQQYFIYYRCLTQVYLTPVSVWSTYLW